MRAIDADKLKIKISGETWELNRVEIWKIIDKQPTIDSEPPWIPCSDVSTLPKDRTFWVTHMNGCEAWVGELYWDMTEWSDRISDVVAYMPRNIPEPYREGEG